MNIQYYELYYECRSYSFGKEFLGHHDLSPTEVPSQTPLS